MKTVIEWIAWYFQRYYPINYLRNVALNASKTDFAYLADVDFIPSKGKTGIPFGSKTGKFQVSMRICDLSWRKWTWIRKPWLFPHSKSPHQRNFTSQKQERSWYENGMMEGWYLIMCVILLNPKLQIQPFRTDIWPAGHNATDYDKWKEAESPYEVRQFRFWCIS